MRTPPPLRRDDPIQQWRRARRWRRIFSGAGMLTAGAGVLWLWQQTRPEPVYQIRYLPTPPALRDAPARPNPVPPAPRPRQAEADSADSGTLPWSLNEQRAEIRDAVDALRAKGVRCGGQWHPPVDRLRSSQGLAQAALAQAAWVADAGEYAHETPDNPAGRDPRERAARAGYGGQVVGENLAWGQATPDAAVRWWSRSPTHCRLLMDPDMQDIGVGAVADPETRHGWVWVMLVGH